MELHDRLWKGKYKGLTLQQVYQGTINIDRGLLSRFIQFKFSDEQTTAFCQMISDITFEIIQSYLVTENQIQIQGIFLNMDNDDRLNIGNVEERLENYLSQEHMFNMQDAEGFVSLSEFNSRNGNKYITGGDPSYIEYCLKEWDDFSLSEDVIRELQLLQVAYYLGIRVVRVGDDVYEYAPKINTRTYKLTL